MKWAWHSHHCGLHKKCINLLRKEFICEVDVFEEGYVFFSFCEYFAYYIIAYRAIYGKSHFKYNGWLPSNTLVDCLL